MADEKKEDERRISVDVSNSTSLTWDEEHSASYLKPGDIVGVSRTSLALRRERKERESIITPPFSKFPIDGLDTLIKIVEENYYTSDAFAGTLENKLVGKEIKGMLHAYLPIDTYPWIMSVRPPNYSNEEIVSMFSESIKESFAKGERPNFIRNEGVVSLVVNEENRLLKVVRRDGRSFFGGWATFGTYEKREMVIHSNERTSLTTYKPESLNDCAIRGCKEELGIEPKQIEEMEYIGEIWDLPLLFKLHVIKVKVPGWVPDKEKLRKKELLEAYFCEPKNSDLNNIVPSSMAAMYMFRKGDGTNDVVDLVSRSVPWKWLPIYGTESEAIELPYNCESYDASFFKVPEAPKYVQRVAITYPSEIVDMNPKRLEDFTEDTWLEKTLDTLEDVSRGSSEAYNPGITKLTDALSELR